jgi:hypothetical protein
MRAPPAKRGGDRAQVAHQVGVPAWWARLASTLRSNMPIRACSRDATALDPNTSIEMCEQPRKDQSPFRVSYQLTPLGAGATRLEFLLVIDGVPTMFAPAVRRRLTGEVNDQFNRLGELLTTG